MMVTTGTLMSADPVLLGLAAQIRRNTTVLKTISPAETRTPNARNAKWNAPASTQENSDESARKIASRTRNVAYLADYAGNGPPLVTTVSLSHRILKTFPVPAVLVSNEVLKAFA